MTTRVRIYAGTVGDTRFYTDVKDCLPPDIRSYAEFDVIESLASIMDLVREREADGLKISWQVGNEFYETSEKVVKDTLRGREGQ